MLSHSVTGTASNGATVEVGTITHEGREFSAMGAVIDTTDGVIVGYPKHGDGTGRDGGHTLRTWDGAFIAALEITGYARGFHGTELTCYALTYEGRRYSGRGLGAHMCLRLKARKQA
jgi:hypothetical protein